MDLCMNMLISFLCFAKLRRVLILLSKSTYRNLDYVVYSEIKTCSYFCDVECVFYQGKTTMTLPPFLIIPISKERMRRFRISKLTDKLKCCPGRGIYVELKYSEVISRRQIFHFVVLQLLLWKRVSPRLQILAIRRHEGRLWPIQFNILVYDNEIDGCRAFVCEGSEIYIIHILASKLN